MVPKRIWFVFLSVLIFAGAAGLLLFGLIRHEGILTRSAEWAANRAGDEFFKGTIRLSRVRINWEFRLMIDSMSASLETPEGPFPFTAERIASEDPLTGFLTGRPVRFSFDKLRPRDSSREGVRGTAAITAGKTGTFELKAEIVRLGLDEIALLNPDNLKGASGEVSGDLEISGGVTAPPKMVMNLVSKKPGGTLQARFFDVFLPYLPQVQRKAIQQTIGALAVIPYQEADMRFELASPERIKTVLHILIPDYNLNLNLNAEIRLEEGHSFLQLAEVFGLIEVKTK